MTVTSTVREPPARLGNGSTKTRSPPRAWQSELPTFGQVVSQQSDPSPFDAEQAPGGEGGKVKVAALHVPDTQTIAS